MSQASVSVFTEFVLLRQQFLEDLRSVPVAVQAVKDELEAEKIHIQVLSNVATLSTSIDVAIAEIEATRKIVIPVIADTAGMVFASPGPLAPVSADNGAGVFNEAPLVAELPENAACPQAWTQAQHDLIEETRGEDYLESPSPSPQTFATPRALLESPQSTQQPEEPQYTETRGDNRPLMTRATGENDEGDGDGDDAEFQAEEAQMAQGTRPPVGGNKGWEQLRKFHMGLLAIQGGVRTVEAGGDLLAASYEFGRDDFRITDEAKSKLYKEKLDSHGKIVREEDVTQLGHTRLEANIESGQGAIRKIPILGGIFADVGEGLNRFGSASTNWAEDEWNGKKNPNFQSDVGYADKLKETTALENEHTNLLERQVEVRKRVNEQLDKETIALNRRAKGRDDGPFDERREVIQGEKDELVRQLAEPQYHLGSRPNAPLTESAEQYRKAKTEDLEAQDSRNNREEQVSARNFELEIGEEKAHLSGDDREERRDKARIEHNKEREQIAKEHSPAIAAAWENDIGQKKLQRDFDNIDTGLALENLESQQRVEDRDQTVGSHRLRAQGRTREAEREDYTHALDHQQQELQNKAEDPKLHGEAHENAVREAQSFVGQKEDLIKSFDENRERQDQEARARLQAAANADYLRAQGSTYDADASQWRAHWEEKIRIAKAANDPALYAMKQTYEAEGKARDYEREQTTEGIEHHTRDLQYEKQGDPIRARIEDVNDSVEKKLKEAGDDDRRRKAVLEEGKAELQMLTPRASISSDPMAIWRNIQMSGLTDAASHMGGITDMQRRQQLTDKYNKEEKAGAGGGGDVVHGIGHMASSIYHEALSAMGFTDKQKHGEHDGHAKHEAHGKHDGHGNPNLERAGEALQSAAKEMGKLFDGASRIVIGTLG